MLVFGGIYPTHEKKPYPIECTCLRNCPQKENKNNPPHTIFYITVNFKQTIKHLFSRNYFRRLGKFGYEDYGSFKTKVIDI